MYLIYRHKKSGMLVEAMQYHNTVCSREKIDEFINSIRNRHLPPILSDNGSFMPVNNSQPSDNIVIYESDWVVDMRTTYEIYKSGEFIYEFEPTYLEFLPECTTFNVTDGKTNYLAVIIDSESQYYNYVSILRHGIQFEAKYESKYGDGMMFTIVYWSSVKELPFRWYDRIIENGSVILMKEDIENIDDYHPEVVSFIKFINEYTLVDTDLTEIDPACNLNPATSSWNIINDDFSKAYICFYFHDYNFKELNVFLKYGLNQIDFIADVERVDNKACEYIITVDDKRYTIHNNDVIIADNITHELVDIIPSGEYKRFKYTHI